MDIEPVPRFAVKGIVADFGDETLRDDFGRRIPLRPPAFAVLRHLAANPDRLVGKEELMAAVWPGIAVTDDSLVQCIGEIRRAIGDDAHAVVRTVPRRGYRLELPEDGAAAAHGAGRWAPATGLAVLLAIAAAGAWWLVRPEPPGEVPLVAVLPFEAVTEDESARLLAKGLTEDVITDLGRIPEFEVLASGATAGYRGEDADPRKAGTELNAAFVVEGSIARDGDRVRVTAQLIDARTGGSLWSDRWDRPAADVFAVQTEIAETIANRLGGGAGLVQETGRNAARRKPPSDLNAYELCLLGTERLERITRPDVEEAVRLLERAVEIDPGFARAWIELSHSHVILAYMGEDPESEKAAAFAAAECALSLDPGDAEAHSAMGQALGVRGDLTRVKAEFDTALRMAPNAAEILTQYAMWASTFGEPERGAAMVDRIVRLDPSVPIWAARAFASAYFFAGRYEEALGMIERIGPDNYGEWMWSLRPGAEAALGRREATAASVKATLEAFPDLTIEGYVSDPGLSDTELQRLIGTMRLAGFPPCATPEALANFEKPGRLPECGARAEATATEDSAQAEGVSE